MNHTFKTPDNVIEFNDVVSDEEIIRRNIRLKVHKDLRATFGNYVYLYKAEASRFIMSNPPLEIVYFHVLTNQRKRFVFNQYELEQSIL